MERIGKHLRASASAPLVVRERWTGPTGGTDLVDRPQFDRLQFDRPSSKGVGGWLRSVLDRRTVDRGADGMMPERSTANAGLDALVVAIAVSQDKAAFAKLFDHFAPRVKAYLMRLGSDDGTSEDIMQEVMLTVWRRASSFDPKIATVSTWMFTIARNKRIDRIRRARHPEFLTDDPAFVPDLVDGADVQFDLLETGERLKVAIAALPAEQADLLRMAYYQDKSHREIADETRLPLGTVKSRIRLALARLRDVLKDET